jgi:hypothetical protein
MYLIVGLYLWLYFNQILTELGKFLYKILVSRNTETVLAVEICIDTEQIKCTSVIECRQGLK